MRGFSIFGLTLLVIAACSNGEEDATTGSVPGEVGTEGATDTGGATDVTTGADAATGADATTGAECPEDGAAASFYYSLGGPLANSPVSVAWGCTVDEVAGSCGEWTVTLSCSDDGVALDQAARLDLSLAPAAGALPFTPGMAVNLRYMEAMPFWLESAIRVEAADGTLLLAGARGSGALDPFSPQEVGPGALLRTSVDECGTSRYYEVAFDLGGAAKGSLVPPSYGKFDAYAVWAVAEDTLASTDECYDLPWAWEEILVLRIDAAEGRPTPWHECC